MSERRPDEGSCDPQDAGGKPQPVDAFSARREALLAILETQIRDPRVLRAMQLVPRHLFVPEKDRWRAYENRALPIADGQTISQPTVVALSTEALALQSDERVLEIGTGSGYQCAVLSRLASEVVSIERSPVLREIAAQNLALAGVTGVLQKLGDGSVGWPEKGPYDAICVTAACPSVPKALVDQLKMGGRLLLPVGSRDQQILRVLQKTESGLEGEDISTVIFVPLIGEQGW